MKTLIAALSCSVLLAGCAGMMQKGPSGSANLQPTRGNQVTGAVNFTQKGDKVLVVAEVSGLTPGLHGFHIHEKGDCSAPDAMSAGGHFNPGSKPHGGPGGSERHGGDLGNLNADSNGKARLSLEIEGVTLEAGANSIIGKGLIVHRDPDDFKTQPTGNSGPRVACGIISLK